MGPKRRRAASPASSPSASPSASPSTSGPSEDADPRETPLAASPAALRGARPEAAAAADARLLVAADREGSSRALAPLGPARPARSPTPEAVRASSLGENDEVRRLLRAPRYFDDDFELAALRCFRCGEGGHREADCAKPPARRPCHLCGRAGHLARDCDRGLCFNCLRPGHRSRDCSEPRGAGRSEQAERCLRCGASGHDVSRCRAASFDARDLDRVACYVCGERGHLCCAPQDTTLAAAAKDGSLEGWLRRSRRRSCCRCGGEGHADSECARARTRPGGGGDRPLVGVVGAAALRDSADRTAAAARSFACFKCGGLGHIARECPAASEDAAAADAGGEAGGAST